MKIIITSVCLLLIGCSKSDSPHEVYDQYVQLEASGISVDQFINAYSKRKRNKIEESVQLAMAKNGLTREQTIEEYLPIFQGFAKCKKLELIDEVIESDTAIISYQSTDDCVEGQVNTKKEIIYMVYEEGWKIDDNDIQELN